VKHTCILLLALLMAAPVLAKDQGKEKKTPANRVVDSGSFGIFMDGKRVGTETFKIEQRPGVSVATAELKVDDGKTRADQTSEMQVTPEGNLRLYTWHSTYPEKEESVVEPKDQLLIEHLTPADQKKQDVPHILPLSTVILDDNFFSHRQMLVWRYFAQGCDVQDSHYMCPTTPTHFSILVPHQHVAGNVEMQLLGRGTTTFKGTEQEFNKFKLTADGVQWILWVDDQYKLVKITVLGNNVEIVRD
jgi:hypothetical protein